MRRPVPLRHTDKRTHQILSKLDFALSSLEILEPRTLLSVPALGTDPTGGLLASPSGITMTPSVVAPPNLYTAFGDTTIPVGGSTRLSFYIQNNNASTMLTGVGFTDTLPAGLVVASPNGFFGSTGGGTLTATPGSNTITLTNASVLPQTTVVFTVYVTGTTSGLKTNTPAAVASNEGGSGPSIGASVTVQGATVAAPTISTSFGAASIPLNGSTSLVFTVGNPNASTALSGVGFTDTLPAGLTIATPNGLAGSYGGGTLGAAAGGNTISLSGASLAAGGTFTFSVNVIGSTAGVKNNSTSAVSSTEGGVGGTASASLTVVSPPVIIGAFGAASISLNGSTSLTFTILNNNATSALTGVNFTDALPAGLVVATPNGLSGSAGGGTVTAVAGTGSIGLSGATVPASGSISFSVNVTGTTAGVKNNSTSNVGSTEGGTGGTGSASLTVNNNNPAIVGTGNFAITGQEGTATAQATVASCWDAAYTSLSDYSATIQWGDGTSGPGTMVAGSGGTFLCKGSHTYAKAGTYSLTVTVNDVNGPPAVVTSSAVISDAPFTSPAGRTVSGVEGNALTNVAVASFKDANPLTNITDMTATIAWGDGASSPGTMISDGAGGYVVQGSHTYSAVGSFAVKVTPADLGGTSTTISSTANIADAPLVGHNWAISVAQNYSFTNQGIASFTDGDPVNSSASMYTATINWGDGTSSAAGFQRTSAGQWNILGSHKYTKKGKFNAVITLKDKGGAPTVTITTPFYVV